MMDTALDGWSIRRGIYGAVPMKFEVHVSLTPARRPRLTLSLLPPPVKAETIGRSFDGPPSLKVIHEAIRDRIAAQSSQVSSLDSRANIGLAAASLLIAATSGLHSSLIAAQAKGAPPFSVILHGRSFTLYTISLCLSAAAFGLYLAVVICWYKAAQLRTLFIAPAPEPLIARNLHHSEDDTRMDLVETLNEVFNRNEPIVFAKIRWIERLLRFLLEGVMNLWQQRMPAGA
jgi:hypothetical protein